MGSMETISGAVWCSLGVSVYSCVSGNSVETRLSEVQAADDCSRPCGVDRLTTVF